MFDELEKNLLRIIDQDCSIVGSKEDCFVNEDLLSYACELEKYLESFSKKAIAGLAYVTWKRFNPDKSPLDKDE